MAKIPREFAEFFFNGDYDSIPDELIVVDQRTRFVDGQIDGNHLISDLPEYRQSLGAHISGWLETSGPRRTPEGVFASLYLNRSEDRQRLADALAEFAKIEGCEWAKAMMLELVALEKERNQR